MKEKIISSPAENGEYVISEGEADPLAGLMPEDMRQTLPVTVYFRPISPGRAGKSRCREAVMSCATWERAERLVAEEVAKAKRKKAGRPMPEGEIPATAPAE